MSNFFFVIIIYSFLNVGNDLKRKCISGTVCTVIKLISPLVQFYSDLLYCTINKFAIKIIVIRTYRNFSLLSW